MSFDPRRIAAAPLGEAHWFIFQAGRLLIDENTGLVPLTAGPSGLGLRADRPVLVGSLRGVPCFAAEADAETEAPRGHAWEGLRALFMRFEDSLVAAAGRAVQLVAWDRDHRYCGRCATPTEPREEEWARACPACGLIAYPRIAPAMMALVTRGRQLLLARAPRFPAGMFSALAGFVEAGESVEETVVREVREEVGVEVSRLRYFGSQSWPFPNSLMIAFVCEYAGGEIRPQAGEIAEAGWFDPDGLPAIPPAISIAGKMIRAVAAELRAADQAPTE